MPDTSNNGGGLTAVDPPKPQTAAQTDFSTQIRGPYVRDARGVRLQADLLESGAALQALRELLRQPTAEQRDMLARCDALLAHAATAARERAAFVAYECLQRIERERVLAMNEDERRAQMALVLAEGRAKLGRWRQEAAEALAMQTRGEAPSVAVLQALMRNLHVAHQNHHHKIALLRQQLPALVLMLGAAVLFFAAWALLGGFDWVARDDVDVTVGMLLVSGVLMGFFGGLVSFAFNWLRADLSARIPDLRAQRWLSFARPAIGAAVAVPIVLFVESGLVNLGQLTPALVLALCFLGGFSERWFMAQIERVAGRKD